MAEGQAPERGETSSPRHGGGWKAKKEGAVPEGGLLGYLEAGLRNPDLTRGKSSRGGEEHLQDSTINEGHPLLKPPRSLLQSWPWSLVTSG